MTELPTKEELKELPVKALVTYAVRNARRVQPLFQNQTSANESLKQTRLIQAALTQAENWAKGENVKSEDLATAKGFVYHTPDVTAYFATACANASSPIAACAYAYEASNAACDAIKSEESFNIAAAYKDFQKLISMNLTADDTIDASPDGPLGGYWPDGEPGWYKEL